MALFLDRIDAAPLAGNEFTFEFNQWVANTVDSLNEVINDIQNDINLFVANSYTATQITDLFTAGQLTNGIILYDTTNNVYVGMQSGTLIKFTTTPYP